MSILIYAEQKEGKVSKASLCAVAVGKQFAEKLGVPYNIAVMGSGIGDAAQALTEYGAAAVVAFDQPELANIVSEFYTEAMYTAAKETGATMVFAAASSTGKACLPRLAAKLGAGMASDVVAYDLDAMTFDHPYYAGKLIATLKVETDVKVVTIRAASFDPAAPVGGGSEVKNLTADFSAWDGKVEFVKMHASASERPDLGEASVVIAGGRGVKEYANFESVIFPLADLLGAAVGTTRAVVDAGVLPNDLQIGQTGQIVAPGLYMAFGISGAIQHLAGMKDSKVIVAVNKDEEAPIFNLADYGLVGDLFKVVPELTEKIKAVKG